MIRQLALRRHGLTIKLLVIFVCMIVLGAMLVGAATRHVRKIA